MLTNAKCSTETRYRGNKEQDQQHSTTLIIVLLLIIIVLLLLIIVLLLIVIIIWEFKGNYTWGGSIPQPPSL